MMMDIRPLQIGELSALRRIAIDTQIDTFGHLNSKQHMEAFLQKAYNMDQIKEEFQEPGSVHCMAWEGNEPAGFLRLRLNQEVEEYLGKNTIELQRIYVSRKFLGKKIGFALMQHALAHARDNKFEWLWLGVWEKNHKAQEFYKKLGFEQFSTHIFWMGPDPQTDWLLKLKL